MLMRYLSKLEEIPLRMKRRYSVVVFEDLDRKCAAGSIVELSTIEEFF